MSPQSHLQRMLYFLIFNLIGEKCTLNVVLICISFIISEGKFFFISLKATFISFSGVCY